MIKLREMLTENKFLKVFSLFGKSEKISKELRKSLTSIWDFTYRSFPVLGDGNPQPTGKDEQQIASNMLEIPKIGNRISKEMANLRKVLQNLDKLYKRWGIK